MLTIHSIQNTLKYQNMLHCCQGIFMVFFTVSAAGAKADTGAIAGVGGDFGGAFSNMGAMSRRGFNWIIIVVC
jgi:hypothetical protein